MTCGTHKPAAFSTFQMQHEIERKRQVTKYQVPKIIQKKLLLYIADDMRVPFCSSGLNVSKLTWDRKKKCKWPKYQEPKIIHEKKLLLYIEDDMSAPFCNSGLIISKAARDQKKKEVAKKSKKRKISIGLRLDIWAFELSCCKLLTHTI